MAKILTYFPHNKHTRYLQPVHALTFSQCSRCPLRLHIHPVYINALTTTHAFPAAATNLNCSGELHIAVATHWASSAALMKPISTPENSPRFAAGIRVWTRVCAAKSYVQRPRRERARKTKRETVRIGAGLASLWEVVGR